MKDAINMTPAELATIQTMLGWSQVRLAEWLEIDRATLGRWQRGQRRIPKAAAVLLRVVVSFRLARDITVLNPALDRAPTELMNTLQRLLVDV
jgi:hypothetical protein